MLLYALMTGPRWNDASRQVVRTIDDQTFRLERSHRVPFSSAFYGCWLAEADGTKIKGYFGLPPSVLVTTRVWLSFMMIFGGLGVTLNALDLTTGSHFTVDPKFGLTLSIVMSLLAIGLYKSATWLGSRRDAGALAFLEEKLTASVQAAK